MHPVMRLYEDSISGSTAAVALPALARMIFVVHGAMTIDGKALSDGEAWSGEGACSLAAGPKSAVIATFSPAQAFRPPAARCKAGQHSTKKKPCRR